MLPGCTLLFYLSYGYIVYVLRTYGIMYKYTVLHVVLFSRTLLRRNHFPLNVYY